MKRGERRLRVISMYLLIINVIGLLVVKSDKQRAVNGEYRISEKSLFMAAILGGSIGTTAGMYEYRHKTKHWYFKLGMPFILFLQILIGSVFLDYILRI